MCKFYWNRQFFILLFLALATYGQEQKLLAILRTVDDGDSIGSNELIFLTGRLREIAGRVLQNRYGIMTDESIINKLGKDARKVCKETEGCLAQLGRKINADYICQARLGRFNSNLTISMELYNSGIGTLINSFMGEAKDVSGLLAVLEEKTPSMFMKMPGVSGERIIKDGIDSVQRNEGYKGDAEKLYIVHLSTEPPGATLSFNGEAYEKCLKTPCKQELNYGPVRIRANLDQYEKADTTVSIEQNNQSIFIKLKPNFGFLEIKPAFLDGIGKDESWNLTINGKAASSWENNLSPNKYKVELSHRCYENISFNVGINKGKREVFDMANNITLKKGGLTLRAERNGEPSIEPVFVNGKQVGETPFSGSVPLCAKIEVGSDKKTVDVKLKHNEKVTHQVKMLEEYELLYNRGNDYRVKGDYDKAIEYYTAALKIKPDYNNALSARGVAYFEKRNYDRAIEDFAAAIRLKPDDEVLLYNRGRAFYEKGDYDRAIGDYNEALKIDPDYYGALIERGSAFLERGSKKYDYDLAIEDFTAAIRLEPFYHRAMNKRGVAYYKKGNYDKAIMDFEAALRLAPNDDTVKENLEDARQKRTSPNPTPTLSTLKDPRDSKTYKTVKIGEQLWMAENLNYEVEGSRCYNDSTAYCGKYGRLYNWNTAKIVCPKSWHLPSNADWNVLMKFVNPSCSNNEDDEDCDGAGTKLKATSGWNSNGNGTDAYGFSALPAGGWGDSRFEDIGKSGFWWSSSEYDKYDDSDEAYARQMGYYYEKVSTEHGDSSYLLSVRCMQDLSSTTLGIKPEVGKPIKTSFWVALGLDVLGAAFIYAGYSKNEAMKQAYDEEYRGHGSDFDTAWKKVESNRSARNTFYVIGGLALASGIGVHIWF
jgi:uncharacterized protein (TIGR02145 family)